MRIEDPRGTENCFSSLEMEETVRNGERLLLWVSFLCPSDCHKGSCWPSTTLLKYGWVNVGGECPSSSSSPPPDCGYRWQREREDICSSLSYMSVFSLFTKSHAHRVYILGAVFSSRTGSSCSELETSYFCWKSSQWKWRRTRRRQIIGGRLRVYGWRLHSSLAEVILVSATPSFSARFASDFVRSKWIESWARCINSYPVIHQTLWSLSASPSALSLSISPPHPPLFQTSRLIFPSVATLLSASQAAAGARRLLRWADMRRNAVAQPPTRNVSLSVREYRCYYFSWKLHVNAKSRVTFLAAQKKQEHIHTRI